MFFKFILFTLVVCYSNQTWNILLSSASNLIRFYLTSPWNLTDVSPFILHCVTDNTSLYTLLATESSLQPLHYHVVCEIKSTHVKTVCDSRTGDTALKFCHEMKCAWHINIIYCCILELLLVSQNDSQAGWPLFDSWQCKIFLFSTASIAILGPTQPPIQSVPGEFSLGVKQQRHKADQIFSKMTEALYLFLTVMMKIVRVYNCTRIDLREYGTGMTSVFLFWYHVYNHQYLKGSRIMSWQPIVVEW
jgi:hypothetical protein